MATSNPKQLEFDRSKKLGGGGFAMVFEGVWNKRVELGNIEIKRIAVKRVELSNIEYNRREDEALKNLKHENIVKLLHAEDDIDFRYFVLELCVASLEKLFLPDDHKRKYKGPIPLPEDVLHDLAKGLEFIHSQHFVHRDINPYNVLIWAGRDVTEKRQVVLKWADFGLSKRVDKIKGTYRYSRCEITGHRDWLAPEILTITKYDPKSLQENDGSVKSDIFSEGLVFGYFLYRGKHLFGSGIGKIETNIIMDNPVNITEIKSSPFLQLIEHMLAYKPEDRITASEIVKQIALIKEQLQEKTALVLKKIGKIKIGCGGGLSLLLDQQPHSSRKQKKFYFNSGDNEGSNILQDDWIELVQTLNQRGIGIKSKTKNELNALHFLCENYGEENLSSIIQLLINKGIDINSKDSAGENALGYLFRNANKDVAAQAIRCLLRYGIQFRHETEAEKYYDMFAKGGNSEMEILRYFAKKDITLGWHRDCQSCTEILTLETISRKQMQHHHKFDNAYLAFQMIRGEIEKYFKFKAEKWSVAKDLDNLIKWLRETRKEDPQFSETLVSSIDILEKMSQQVKIGGDSSQYNCDEYEGHMRAIRQVAEYIGAERTKKQIDWFYLLPFDFPSIEPEITTGNNNEIRKCKMEWDQTLFKWAHKRDSDYFGKYLRENAEEGFFVPEKYHHKCHGQQEDK